MARAQSATGAVIVSAALVLLTMTSCSAGVDDLGPERTKALNPTVVSPAPTATPTPTPTPPWNVAHDEGPSYGAHGTIVTDAQGVPVRYVVADGDTQGAICNRLSVRWWQLKTGGVFLGTYPHLAIAQVIDVVDVPRSAAGDVQSTNALC